MTVIALILFWVTAGMLFYMLVGYSIVLLAVRRLANAPVAGDYEPSVSLIIPAHNEEAVIAAKLENALAIDYPREKLQILVASDGSSDNTISLAQQYCDRGVAILDFQQRRGKASAVNDAVAQATGEVLCLCDANVMFAPDALRRLVSWLADDRVGAATGVVRLASEESNFGHGETFYYQLERAIQLAESDVGSLMGVDGGMYVLRKKLFRPLPADSLLDDFAIAMQIVRQRQRIVYDAQAFASESGTPRAMQEFRRRVRMAAGVVQVLRRGDFPSPLQPLLFWQFVSHKLLRWMGPFLLITMIGSNAMLLSQGPVYQGAFAAQMFVYCVAVLG
ncbi:MAG: glycosyltransferase family 2 protein, partial [Planctomycetales bacterium]|nr:glycosyltransferase family 2 protein [Planctomycetales bacterium]